jgi:hypothetical protein
MNVDSLHLYITPCTCFQTFVKWIRCLLMMNCKDAFANLFLCIKSLLRRASQLIYHFDQPIVLEPRIFPMPSKGIQCYSYNSVSDCQIEFSVPGKILTKTSLKQWTNDHLEVDKTNIPGPFNFNGVFRCRVIQQATELFNKYVEINVLTGNLQSGNMKDMLDQTSVLANGVSISFTFYDAPNKSVAGLPTSDQFYVSVTGDNSNWMGVVAPPHSPVAAQPFTRLILPAAHDIGMNSLQNAEACIQNAAVHFLASLKADIPAIAGAGVSDTVLTGFVPNIVQGLAITQKDSLSTILNLGARYFEFRPAYIENEVRKLEPIPNKLYFMHGPIPGMGYDEFLSGCFQYLVRHPGEVIVTQLRWDGVPADCARPSAQALQDCLTQVTQATRNIIQVGSLEDMQNLSIDDLRAKQKRFILLENVASLSSYSDSGNATLTGDSIITEFNALTRSGQSGNAFTNLQCQATATNLGKVVLFSSLTANVSNSCLLCTKAVCDNKTMPWIKLNALSKLTAEQNIVIMDDFFDGGICDLARDLSLQRLLGQA